MVHSKRHLETKKILISILITIIVIITIGYSIWWVLTYNPDLYQGNILIMGLEPAESHKGLVCEGLGWADLNMIVSIQDRIRIVSFPRDSLVDIPGRGKWLINAIHFNQGFEGSRRYFEEMTGLQIDDVVIIKLEDIRELAQRFAFLGRIHPAFKRLLQDYEYTEDWIRHRRLLGVEYNRQLRIQKYIHHLISTTAKIRLPRIILTRIGEIITNQIYKTDLNVDQIVEIKRRFDKKDVDFYIWPGEYRKCAFDYSWYQGTNFCYILERIEFQDMIQRGPVRNPFIYTTNRFFAGYDSGYIYYNGVTKRSGQLYRVFNTFQ